MISIQDLSEDEILYLCSVIPFDSIKAFFRSNPKEFSIVMPGFRVQSLNDEKKAGELLFKYRHKHFISSYIENNLSSWTKQIQEHLAKKIDEGNSKEASILMTLLLSYVSDNPALFLKMIESDYNEDFIRLLSATSLTIKDYAEKNKQLSKDLKTLEFLHTDISKEIKKIRKDFDINKIESNKKTEELERLKDTIKEHEKLRFDIRVKEEENRKLESIVINNKNHIEKLSTEMSTLLENNKILEKQNIAKMNEQQSIISAKDSCISKLELDNVDLSTENQRLLSELAELEHKFHQLQKQLSEKPSIILGGVTVGVDKASTKALAPRDISDFKIYMGDNLERIGITANTDVYYLLIEHLSKILFQGLPIVISRNTGSVLIKCVANTLIETQDVATLILSKDISESLIEEFLSKSGRVVCLDNFIGNINETNLLPIFDRYRNKIIFLTYAYDRTLRFIPEEFLRYCHYLNLNRIEAFLGNNYLDADPSSFDEEEVLDNITYLENRYSKLLRDIVDDFGLPKNIAKSKCAFIADEKDLCCSLAFDVLPYCVDVMQQSPFNLSDTLVRFVENGRCTYKDLFNRWFA